MVIATMAPIFCHIWKVFLMQLAEPRGKLFHGSESVQSFYVAANTIARTTKISIKEQPRLQEA